MPSWTAARTDGCSATWASHNGTRVNGWLVREPVPVRPGDVLQFGSAMFVITGPEGPGNAPASEGKGAREMGSPP